SAPSPNSSTPRLRGSQAASRDLVLAVDADGAGTETDDVEEATRHHQILVEIDHVVEVSRPQMHAESGPEAEQRENCRGPSGLETHDDRRTAENMDCDGNPDRDLRSRYVHAGEILSGACRIAQLQDAVPDEEAGHQQARKRKQIGFAVLHGASSLLSAMPRAAAR